MTTAAAPTAVEWIRFATGQHEWVQLDAAKEWAPRLLVSRSPEVDDLGDTLTGRPRLAAPKVLVTVDLVVLKQSAHFACKVEIEKVHRLLESQPEFSIEAAVTMPGLPYIRVSVPRLTAEPLAVEPVRTEAGELALRFLDARAFPVGDGRQYDLTRVD